MTIDFPAGPNAIENSVLGNGTSDGREMRRELDQLRTLAQGGEFELAMSEEIVRFSVDRMFAELMPVRRAIVDTMFVWRK